MTQEMNADTEFLTTKELAKWMRVSPRTQEGLRVSGKGPPYTRLGDCQNAKVVYSRSAVVEWMARNTHPKFSAVETRMAKFAKNGANVSNTWRSAFCSCERLLSKIWEAFLMRRSVR